MKTDTVKKTNTTESKIVEGESKEVYNQKTSRQFLISITIGILTIIAIAASAYYGIAR